MNGVGEAAKAAARDAYGRLLAFLSRRTGDIAAAEDALSEAFVAALSSWPRDGVPQEPAAWLASAAARKLIDAHRGRKREAAVLEELASRSTPAETADDRLPMMLALTHEAVAPEARSPLMLQCVLGLSVEQIAGLLLLPAGTLGRRLSRAKRKIRDAGVPITVPGDEVLVGRLPAVLDAVYGAFTAGWDRGTDAEAVATAAEAIQLGETVCRVLPDDAEAWGLLALMRYAHARRAARRDAAGRFVPLEGQDPAAWDGALTDAADGALRRAASLRRPGPYQTRAAIQSVHADRRRTGTTRWDVILSLYETLAAADRSAGAAVGRAATLVRMGRNAEAVAALDALEPDAVRGHQPYWAVRAEALRGLDGGAAREAAERAVGLTADPGVRAYLAGRFAS